ncbi:MAG TPA: aspartate aminotransferase family protein [Solibacterales bacterium]|nr:aspartate aminotransferase family protein [Bryobacterales bacterium]
MSQDFSIAPRPVSWVDTPFRRILGEFPVAASVPLLEQLRALEPLAMRGQPPVVWHRAEGCQVEDAWGNRWLDWSSGVLITNAGHGRREIADAVAQQAHALLASYCFPTEIRARLVSKLASLLPAPLAKVFLLTTGSETVECAVKLCRTHGLRHGGRAKNVIVSFESAFHGRTLGAQQAGGIPALKEWIGHLDPGFVQVPFPDNWRTADSSFEGFLRALQERGVECANVAGVILETYQGGSAAFAPVAFMQALRQWCTGRKALLVCDEVQAGFGRCGTRWGFEHYGIVPDVACFGKGISSSLPIAAVAGSAEVMDLHPPGSMTSTHTGSPVCCAAALASIELVESEQLAQNAARMGAVLHQGLRQLAAKIPQIGRVEGRGLVAGVACVRPGTKEPDGALAFDVVQRSIEKGLLMFAPVGFGGGTVKICPPLVITEAAVRDGLAALEEAFSEALASKAAAA